MTSPSVSPVVPFYANRLPYITVAEYLAAPTGVDSSQIIPGNGGLPAQQAALASQIRRASSYVDRLCFQVLAATSDFQSGEYRVWPDGTIRVAFDYSPVVEVTAVSWGWQAGKLTALTDLSGLWPGRKVWRIPVGVGAVPQILASSSAAMARRGSVFAQIQYVNGYAVTTLAADAAAAATSLVAASPLGLFAGLPLTVQDDAAGTTEQVVVASGYVQGSTTVPLTAPLVGAHKAGAAVSALPEAVKQATIALTTHLIKTRGAESLVVGPVSGIAGGPVRTSKDLPGASEEYELAVDLLRPYARVR